MRGEAKSGDGMKVERRRGERRTGGEKERGKGGQEERRRGEKVCKHSNRSRQALPGEQEGPAR